MGVGDHDCFCCCYIGLLKYLLFIFSPSNWCILFGLLGERLCVFCWLKYSFFDGVHTSNELQRNLMA